MFSDENIRKEIENLSVAAGLEVYEIIVNKRGYRKDIRVFIDKEWGGISVAECREFSRQISDGFFKNQISSNDYFLEVSSPGIDRPLKNVNDFKRNRGRTVEIKVKDEEGQSVCSGIIKEINEDILLKTDGGEMHIPFENIINGKVIIKW